jgi:hypothetical protein
VKLGLTLKEHAGCYRKSFITLKEDIHNVLNWHNVAKHCKFDASGTVAPITELSAPAVEIKMATCTGAERACCVFWFDYRSQQRPLRPLLQELELHYDWRFTANHFLLAPSRLTHDHSFFLQLNPCCYSLYVVSSLTRGWACLL